MSCASTDQARASSSLEAWPRNRRPRHAGFCTVARPSVAGSLREGGGTKDRRFIYEVGGGVGVLVVFNS